MAVVAVRADPEHLRANPLEVPHRIAERAELTLAGTREVENVEGQYDRAAAPFLRQGDGLPLVAQHRKIWGLPPDVDHRKSGSRDERNRGNNPFASELEAGGSGPRDGIYIKWKALIQAPHVRPPDRRLGRFIDSHQGRENNRKVRARRGLHPDDGLPERPAGHLLQLHPDGLLAIPSGVPDPREFPS